MRHSSLHSSTAETRECRTRSTDTHYTVSTVLRVRVFLVMLMECMSMCDVVVPIILGGHTNPSILRRRREDAYPCNSSLSPPRPPLLDGSLATVLGKRPTQFPLANSTWFANGRDVRLNVSAPGPLAHSTPELKSETRRVRRRAWRREPRIPHVSSPARAQAASTPTPSHLC